MAELVDAADSKSAILTNVSVQVGLGVPIIFSTYGFKHIF